LTSLYSVFVVRLKRAFQLYNLSFALNARLNLSEQLQFEGLDWVAAIWVVAVHYYFELFARLVSNLGYLTGKGWRCFAESKESTDLEIAFSDLWLWLWMRSKDLNFGRGF